MFSIEIMENLCVNCALTSQSFRHFFPFFDFQASPFSNIERLYLESLIFLFKYTWVSPLIFLSNRPVFLGRREFIFHRKVMHRVPIFLAFFFPPEGQNTGGINYVSEGRPGRALSWGWKRKSEKDRGSPRVGEERDGLVAHYQKYYQDRDKDLKKQQLDF